MTTATSDWLQCLETREGARLRFVCVPHAGGAASAYAGWHEELPEDVEVWAVQPPGRENRLLEPPVAGILEMAAMLGPEVPALFEDAEVVLFGHCLGSLVAFETARWLRDNGHRLPALLVVSGHPAPELHWRYVEPVHELPDDELVQTFAEFEGTADGVFEDPELLELLIPALRADAAAHNTYVFEPEEPLDVDILAVAGSEDPETTEDTLRGWAQETTRDCTVRTFPGGHFYHYEQRGPLLRTILETLEAR